MGDRASKRSNSVTPADSIDQVSMNGAAAVSSKQPRKHSKTGTVQAHCKCVGGSVMVCNE